MLLVVHSFDLSKFPKDFLFGTATSSYQIEGAANEDGRAPSIWDTFSKLPNKTYNGDNGDVACDHYHRFRDDIKLMKDVGFKVYRFSISWSRILPTGRMPINRKGVEFYNSLIDELLRNDIIPFITLYHWDLPDNLQKEYKGLLSEKFVTDFAEYSKICFQLFGDRVKNWITFNEPFVVAVLGHDFGVYAPGRCSERDICKEGNSPVEVYKTAHNLLNAHALAVTVFRSEFASQQGQIGISLNSDWNEPRTQSSEDIKAAQRLQEFQLGWFADPIFFGDYPNSMKKNVGSRLPTFTDKQKKMLKGSADFLGLNAYTSRYVTNETVDRDGFQKDTQTTQYTTDAHGNLIGQLEYPEWLYVVPWGMRKLINWSFRRYRAPIYITENGVAEINDPFIPIEKALRDDHRINYYRSYLNEIYKSIQDGSSVKGYMAWSLMDNFEWTDGYSARFGIHYVDFDNLTRIQKSSAKWWKNELVFQYDEPSFWNQLEIFIWISLIATISIILFSNPDENTVHHEEKKICKLKCRGRSIIDQNDCKCIQKPYSILIITDEFSGIDKHGGIGASFYRLASYLSKLHSYKITVAFSNYPNCVKTSENQKCEFQKWKEIYQTENIHFTTIKNVDNIEGNDEMKKSFKIFQWLKKRQSEYDIIHFHDYLGLGYYSMMSKKLKISFKKNLLVNGLHGTSWFVNIAQQRTPYDINILKMKYLEERSIEFSDSVISPSKFYLNWLKKKTKIKIPKDQQVLPNIMNSKVIINEEKQKKSHIDHIDHLVFMGRFSAVKGFDLFLDALNELSLEEKYSSKIKKISFLGNFESQDIPKSIDKYFKIKTLKWKWEYKFFIGKDTQFCMNYLLNSKGVAVIPSRIETYSSVVIEMIHNKIPFIASNAGAIPELMKNSQDKILFNPELNSLIDKMKEILDNGIPMSTPFFSISKINQMWFDFHKNHLQTLKSNKFTQDIIEKKPTVSVILSLYTKNQFKIDFILNQFSQQTNRNFELIILNSMSNDDFYQLKSKFKHLKISGLSFKYSNSFSKNMAAKMSSRDYLLFISSNEIPKITLIDEFLTKISNSKFKILYDFFDFSKELNEKIEKKENLISLKKMKKITILKHGPSSNVEFFENSMKEELIFIERNLFKKIKEFEIDLSLIQIKNCENWQLNSKISLLVDDSLIGVIPKSLHFQLNSPLKKKSLKERYLNKECGKRILKFYIDNTPSRIHGWLLFTWKKYLEINKMN
eukprot:gene10266-2685_t